MQGSDESFAALESAVLTSPPLFLSEERGWEDTRRTLENTRLKSRYDSICAQVARLELNVVCKVLWDWSPPAHSFETPSPLAIVAAQQSLLILQGKELDAVACCHTASAGGHGTASERSAEQRVVQPIATWPLQCALCACVEVRIVGRARV